MICVCVGTNDKLVSKLIRWATDSEFSHAWIEYPSMVWCGLWVAHAIDSGVTKQPQEVALKNYPKYEVYECKIDLADGLQWARRYVGIADYDYGAAIWNGILLVLYRVTHWEWLSRIVLRNAAKMTCSELVAGILKHSGAAGTEDMDIELTTTGALRSFCRASDDFEIINGQDESNGN